MTLFYTQNQGTTITRIPEKPSTRNQEAMTTEILENTEMDLLVKALEGDVHDLGKNIFKTVLVAKGFRVKDCGKDCLVDRILDVTAGELPLALGISGLITTVIPKARLVKEGLIRRGLGHIKVMAGGAALNQVSAKGLNVDFVAQTSFDGLRYLEKLDLGGM